MIIMHLPVLIGVLCIVSLANGLVIDITKKDFLTINDHQVTEENLHNFLEDHERVLLFGDGNKKVNFQLISVSRRPRAKRSLTSIIRINYNNKNEPEEIQLNKSESLVDDAFVFIERFENSSTLIEDYPQLASKYKDCFYKNNFSALDLCDGSIKGIIRHNSTDLLIHPLPPRFGEDAHIISETSILRKDFSNRLESIDFEPKWEEFEPINETTTPTSHSQNDFGIRSKRFISNHEIPKILHVETALFVDKDLFRHMSKNFPDDTESQLIRFVLAMINGVQLLYHHPSLGHRINFVLKRLEILHTDPKELRRSSDIDIFLNSFCHWQRKFNPVSDADVMHYDHAVILTGLDLYVVAKNGKVSSQVVGLAPVAGMCTATSSCTINEGKHFESVFVVAHEIGHNLGMRHDTSENSCDPSLFIMSPTLGSGKITWSKCSRNYLKSFLETSQARCLFDRDQFGKNLDHAAEGSLPGERFNADQQCMLKYGKDSSQAKTQPLNDVCRDLHCQRDRYTWTSHPALEGTICGDDMFCRSGICVQKSNRFEAYTAPRPAIKPIKTLEKASFVDEKKFASLKHPESANLKISQWSAWSAPTECESGCLYGESGRLKEGSTGLKIYTRTCLDSRWNRKKCLSLNKKYESCVSRQCYNIPRTTVLEFANDICQRANDFDSDILSDGVQEVSNSPYESCKVFCKTNSGELKSKGWTFPDGTTCRNQDSDIDDSYYCVNGRCEKFMCENSTTNLFRTDPTFCPQNQVLEEFVSQTNNIQQENGRDYKSVGTKNHLQPSESVPIRRIAQTTSKGFHKANTYHKWRSREPERLKSFKEEPKPKDEWVIKSGCHFSCMEMSKGIQVVSSQLDSSTNIQLCSPETYACDKLQSPIAFATKVCHKYKLRINGLSGVGAQISPSVDDPDRSCKIACQDDLLVHRFYLVNGENGFFPFGTKCSQHESRYCVNGKCLPFGADNIPLKESQLSLSVNRSKRAVQRRMRRHFINYDPINITEIINQQFLDSIVHNIFLKDDGDNFDYDQIDLTNPIHISMDTVNTYSPQFR